ncbi:MAG: helix-turn-helix domain-containing protein [Eubacteriales bacterium]
MEKKTIGKFISALRKANGMTQKELGEKLFVSDKTVSRWECDECTPELSLIPLIAEIFDVTTDELLRGERNNPDRDAVNYEETANRQKLKSDRQFKLILDKRNRKYKNLTLISIGISIFGFIAAMIANLGFSKGLIAFCLAAAFCVASEICQICFAINANIAIDEEDDTYTDRIEEANTRTTRTAVTVSFVNMLLFMFCLPLVSLIDGANFGLVFEYWLVYGFLFSCVAFVIGYVIYTLFVRKILCKRRLIVLSDRQKNVSKKNEKLLKRTVAVFVIIAIAIGTGIIVLNSMGRQAFRTDLEFDSCDDFKAFMESDYDRWLKEGYSYVDENGNTVYDEDIEFDDRKVYNKIRNAKGEVICEYYHNPDLYMDIIFTESADDKMPVTVITKEAYYNALDTFRTIESTLYTLIVIDFVISAAVYLLMSHKTKNNE